MSTWTTAQRLAMLGLLIVVFGLFAGCLPKSSEGNRCGSAFAPYEDETAQEIDDLASRYGVPREASDCDKARAGGMKVALILLSVGGALMAGGWVVNGRRDTE